MAAKPEDMPMFYEKDRRRCDLPLSLRTRAAVIYRGYRCIGGRSTLLWDRSRRDKYLLEPDVPIPISCDRTVTPEASEIDAPCEKVELLVIGATEGDGHASAPWNIPDTEFVELPLGDEWLFLGYDICDMAEISGLMNVGMSDAQLRPYGYWRLAVNRYHLFDRYLDADSFRKWCDKRVVEHSPFVVMALYACLPTLA